MAHPACRLCGRAAIGSLKDPAFVAAYVPQHRFDSPPIDWRCAEHFDLTLRELNPFWHGPLPAYESCGGCGRDIDLVAYFERGEDQHHCLYPNGRARWCYVPGADLLTGLVCGARRGEYVMRKNAVSVELNVKFLENPNG